MSKELSIQEHYAPNCTCFGCGPANKKGLRIKSFPKDDLLLCHWKPEPHHEAFSGCLSGGIIGVLLDCHSNCYAAWHFMKKNSWDKLGSTVTANYSIALKKPTPTDTEVYLEAKIVKSEEMKVWIEATLSSQGEICATSKGCFVLVKPGHIAYGRWQ